MARDQAIATAVRVEVENDRRAGMVARGDVRVGRGPHGGERAPVTVGFRGVRVDLANQVLDIRLPSECSSAPSVKHNRGL